MSKLSNFLKALSLILAIIVSLLTILQWVGQVDVYSLLVVPIVNFFTFPVPVYSIPLAFLIVVGFLFGWAYLGDKTSHAISNPFDRADFLDKDSARYMALLCKNPQAPDSLKQKYGEFTREYGGYEYDYCVKELEERKLIMFQDGKWTITPKAIAYVAKYHGG